jgi:acetyl-CoA acetyltransferase
VKLILTPAESNWLNQAARALQMISIQNAQTERMAHLANRIAYQTTGAPTQVHLTRPQRVLIMEVAKVRFRSLDLIPCEERDIVAALIEKMK